MDLGLPTRIVLIESEASESKPNPGSKSVRLFLDEILRWSEDFRRFNSL